MSTPEVLGLIVNCLLFAVGIISPLVALVAAFTVDEYPASRALKTFIPCMVLSLGFAGIGSPLVRWLAPDFTIMRSPYGSARFSKL